MNCDQIATRISCDVHIIACQDPVKMSAWSLACNHGTQAGRSNFRHTPHRVHLLLVQCTHNQFSELSAL